MNTRPRTSALRIPVRAALDISRPRASKARSFTAVSVKLNTLTDEYEIAREAVDGVMSILGARAGLFMMPFPSELLYSKHTVLSVQLVNFEQTLLQRGQEILGTFSLEPNIRFHNTDGLLLVPLTWRGRASGLLVFDCEGRNLAPYDEMGLLALCNQLAAIFGSRSRPASIPSDESFGVRREEARLVGEIQQNVFSSMPSKSCGLSIATHTQAAEYVSGDYFDLVLVDRNRMGIVIADVEGKGVSAALYGNLLRTTVHFLTRESPSTAAVVGKINAILHKEASQSQRLFTLFYSVFDPASRSLTYTGSGHVSPIVLRSTTDNVERLHSDGAPMGVQTRQRFTERSVQLGKEDLVAYFTDGIIECTNAKREIFGEERLIRILMQHKEEAVEKILKAVLHDVAHFAAGPPADDLTIIVTKVA